MFVSLITCTFTGILLFFTFTDNRKDLSKCQMTMMSPEYSKEHLPSFFAYKYSLYKYIENGYSIKGKKAIIYLPGNRGCYKQMRSLGKVLALSQYRYNLSKYDLYGIDFNEEFSAMMSGTLEDQAKFTKDSIDFLTKKYKAKVIVVGHSMGSVVARLSDTENIQLLITLASPLVHAPLKFERYILNVYKKQKDVPMFSIASGNLDFQVDSGINNNDVYSSGTVFSWATNDHNSIVFDNGLLRSMVQSLLMESDDIIETLRKRFTDHSLMPVLPSFSEVSLNLTDMTLVNAGYLNSSNFIDGKIVYLKFDVEGKDDFTVASSLKRYFHFDFYFCKSILNSECIFTDFKMEIEQIPFETYGTEYYNTKMSRILTIFSGKVPKEAKFLLIIGSKRLGKKKIMNSIENQMLVDEYLEARYKVGEYERTSFYENPILHKGMFTLVSFDSSNNHFPWDADKKVKLNYIKNYTKLPKGFYKLWIEGTGDSKFSPVLMQKSGKELKMFRNFNNQTIYINSYEQADHELHVYVDPNMQPAIEIGYDWFGYCLGWFRMNLVYLFIFPFCILLMRLALHSDWQSCLFLCGLVCIRDPVYALALISSYGVLRLVETIFSFLGFILSFLYKYVPKFGYFKSKRFSIVFLLVITCLVPKHYSTLILFTLHSVTTIKTKSNVNQMYLLLLFLVLLIRMPAAVAWIYMITQGHMIINEAGLSTVSIGIVVWRLRYNQEVKFPRFIAGFIAAYVALFGMEFPFLVADGFELFNLLTVVYTLS